jgi:hypothetical protein
MSAKKVVKKAASRSSRKAVAPVSTTFQAIVNGTIKGNYPLTGTIGEAAMNLAREAGIKSYNVRVNGVPIDETVAGQALTAKHVSVEVFAKDTRG